MMRMKLIALPAANKGRPDPMILAVFVIFIRMVVFITLQAAFWHLELKSDIQRPRFIEFRNIKHLHTIQPAQGLSSFSNISKLSCRC